MISTEERAFQVLLKLGGCATSTEIAHELGLPGPRPATRAGNLMKELVQTGRVERVGGRGVYRIRRLAAIVDECPTP